MCEPMVDPPDSVTVWFCDRGGVEYAVHASSHSSEEFDYPGLCPTCREPLVKAEYRLAASKEEESNE